MDDPIDNDVLISLVEARPVLWDKTSDTFKDRNQTRDAWREVCCALKEDFESLESKEKNAFGKEVTKRWGILRDAFSRANRKLKDCKRSGAGAVNIKKYVYADQMKFLSKLFQSREVTESLEGRTYEDENENDDDPTEAPLHRKVTPSPQGTKRCRRPDEVEEKIIKALDEQPLSPHVSFINGLMPHLIKFTDREILEFQMGVLEVISKITNKRQNAAQPPPPFPPQTPTHYHQNFHLPQYPQFPTSQMCNINQPNTFNSFQPQQHQINQSPNPQIQQPQTAKVSNKDSNKYQLAGPSNIRPPGQEQNTAKYYEDFGNTTAATTPESYPSASPSPADSVYSETYDFS